MCSNVLRSDQSGKYKHTTIFKRFCLLIFRERGKERQREGEKHQLVASPYVP